AVALVLTAVGCASTATSSSPGAAPQRVGPQAPVAARRPYQVKSPNGDRDDPYYWLRDDTRKSPDVLGYLNAENDYARAVFERVRQREGQLLAGLKGQIQDNDSSGPVFDDGYWYYRRFSAGQEQPVFARRKGDMDAPEQVVLDGNELAPGHPFFSFGG